MKTWEMIKALTENPNKKFTYDTATKGSYVTVVLGEVVWQGESQYGQNVGVLVKKDDWKEVKESVDFMTAFKAYREGKSVYAMRGGRYQSRYVLSKDYFRNFHEEDIASKWYIED